jgi:hypothetical protein
LKNVKKNKKIKEVEDKWPMAVWRDWSGLALMNPRK